MNIADPEIYQRHKDNRTSMREVVLVSLVFAGMGAITWAIRGTAGWGGMDGTLVPGLTWGLLWWYVCWQKGIDARGIPLWLGLGITLGGELGYGQYVSWLRGDFNVGDEILPISAWLSLAWFGVCGIGWAAPGGIALGWTFAGRKSLGVWLARLMIPLGFAFLTRIAIQTWPWLFFPKWDLGLYVAESNATAAAEASTSTQGTMLAIWFFCALLSVIACVLTTKVTLPQWIARGVQISAVGIVSVLLLPVAQWLFFPSDALGMFAGELGGHLSRTVYTNSQNAIVVGWWIGALFVAALNRDRQTWLAGLVIGAGFGVGFPLSALWCLGYQYDPHLVDWWKIWELQSGFNLGLLYVAVLYWAVAKVENKSVKNSGTERSTYQKWCETTAAATGVALIVHVLSRDYFLSAGVFLAILYVAPLMLTAFHKEAVGDRQRGVSFVYSVFLLLFIMAWGVSEREGILLGLYDPKAVDQYAWPTARKIIFAPAGIVIVAAGLFQMWRAIFHPPIGQPPSAAAPRISARLVDLMTFTGVVGAISIWPAKIGACYAIVLCLVLFAFNRFNLVDNRLTTDAAVKSC
ncbi:hypothetical protein CA54_25260 [Symmachiella macrocystis]|uniref:Uncharacterized protein n=1 Tax=Symmachiella macrocystis TaxID=2527985 RepID=A0A5C6BQM4_9PLAN|nr:hypothetical protein [Symmachiella macrocystis]TWU13691.1 hypothetical protein CA54_25260 [Symmachiella macrocystis]